MINLKDYISGEISNLKDNSAYWGSERQIERQNLLFAILKHFYEYDVEEDEAATTYFLKSTVIEMFQYTTEIIDKIEGGTLKPKTAEVKTFKEFISTQKEITVEEYLKMENIHHDQDDIKGVEGYIGSSIAAVILFGGWYIFKLENGKFWVEYDRTDLTCDSILEAQMYFWNGFAKHEMQLDNEDMIEDLHDQCVIWIDTQAKGRIGIDELYKLEGLTDQQKEFAGYLQNEFEKIDI